MHVDSDDWIERNIVELCVERQKETGADYVYFDIVMHHWKYDKRMFRRYFVDDVQFFRYFGKQLLGLYKDPFEKTTDLLE